MEDTVIIGNSIVRDLNIEGIDQVVMSGRKLAEMRPHLVEGQALKIVVSGIPDIMVRGADRVSGEWVTEYERQLITTSNLPGVVLCPFYPSRSLIPSQYGIVQRLNNRICELNAEKGRGTPAITAGLFGRSRHRESERDSIYFMKEQLRDDVHPGTELAANMSEIIKRYVRTTRRTRGDLREVLRGEQQEGQDIRQEDRERRVLRPEVGTRRFQPQRDREPSQEREWEIVEREKERLDRAADRREKREEEAKERYDAEMWRIEEEYVREVKDAQRGRQEEKDRMDRRRREERRRREGEIEEEGRRREERRRREREDRGRTDEGRRMQRRDRDDTFRNVDIRDGVPRIRVLD